MYLLADPLNYTTPQLSKKPNRNQAELGVDYFETAVKLKNSSRAFLLQMLYLFTDLQSNWTVIFYKKRTEI